ncbi:MAG: hypothetical protein MH321_03225 [Leptospiraceae bacterium]|nr:hypothetical protein [Leptospiraceae bacterium]
MILPTKHIKLENSIFYVGGLILIENIDGETVSSLWGKISQKGKLNSFEKFVLGLDFLFLIGVIDFQQGLLKRIK